MNAEQLEGNWQQLKGAVREQWGRLSDDDIDKVLGKRDKLVGKIRSAMASARRPRNTK